MSTPARLLMLALVATTLTLAGCSYQPARIQSKPLVEIDSGYPHYSGRRHYHDDDGYYRHRDYRRERHHYHERDRHRGRFCPPGLRMQGRC